MKYLDAVILINLMNYLIFIAEPAKHAQKQVAFGRDYTPSANLMGEAILASG
jgi:hypothetical protein